MLLWSKTSIFNICYSVKASQEKMLQIMNKRSVNLFNSVFDMQDVMIIAVVFLHYDCAAQYMNQQFKQMSLLSSVSHS